MGRRRRRIRKDKCNCKKRCEKGGAERQSRPDRIGEKGGWWQREEGLGRGEVHSRVIFN